VVPSRFFVRDLGLEPCPWVFPKDQMDAPTPIRTVLIVRVYVCLLISLEVEVPLKRRSPLSLTFLKEYGCPTLNCPSCSPLSAFGSSLPAPGACRTEQQHTDFMWFFFINPIDFLPRRTLGAHKRLCSSGSFLAGAHSASKVFSFPLRFFFFMAF